MINKIEKYENYSASAYYDVVIGSLEAPDAMYYLLNQRLRKALGRVYELYGSGLDDDYGDTINDFYLYLHDYGDGQPFLILDTIREKQAFFGWTVSTYRNFLLNKVKEEMRRRTVEQKALWHGEDERRFSDETLLRFLSTAIAFEDQELMPRDRFIFYRMILTLLNPSLALPQEAMAKVLEMHHVTYRVRVNRLKNRFSQTLTALEKGQRLTLDDTHQRLAERLLRHFDHLYVTLLPYYEASIEDLENNLEINMLRSSNGFGGMLMHEQLDYSYPHVVDVRRLYHELKS